MKRTFFIITLLSLILVSCEKKQVEEHNKDLYFYNELELNINLEIFDSTKVSNFELSPNDSVFFTTLSWISTANNDKNITYIQSPVDVVYQDFLCSIDSVKVHYNAKTYTYYHDKHIENSEIVHLLHCNGNLIRFDENKKQNFGWE